MRHLLALVCVAVVLVSVFLSAGAARAETAPAPGAQPEGPAAPHDAPPARPRRRPGLLIGGLVTWGISYTISVATAFATLGSYNGAANCTSPCPPSDNSETRDLLIPVVGPWMAMTTGHSRDNGLLAFLGIAQATGVALTVGGIVRLAGGGAASESRDSSGARPRASRPGSFLSFGVLPARDGAFGFLSGRM